ncbi:MAG: iron ABC transporter permease [Chloroflexi bacterium]|nr:iron ABC transporter permease [Chloroflexota bacterium]
MIKQKTKNSGIFLILVGLLLLVVALNLSLGSVRIPLSEIFKALTGQPGIKDSWVYIVNNYRLPKIITAILAGMALSAAGLQMQTIFRNPLADPYILGINSGASLGVAIAVMGSSLAGGLFIPSLSIGGDLGLVGAASLGAGAVMGLILLVGRRVQNPTTLLILGLMFGLATGALVSLLIYFSEPEKVKAYSIWSYGAFNGVTWQQLKVLLPVVLFALGLLAFLPKGLNALLLGEDYAKTMGLNVSRLRFLILVSSSVLSGAVTAFCGPIGFIGVAVPHIARNVFKTSNHKLLIPAVILIGAIVAVSADLVAQMPDNQFVLPINVVTSLFGAPFVLWIVLKRNRGSTSFNV